MPILEQTGREKSRTRHAAAAPERCRRIFLRFFPKGFSDAKYYAWERGYKWAAHKQWTGALNKQAFAKLLKARQYVEIASIATRIESRTNLLFSFEKMALRDAVRAPKGAEIFATALFDLLHGPGRPERKFDRWCEAVGALPRKQTRVLTHPVVTVFPFIAQPDRHIFLKPNATKTAAREYAFDFEYNSRASWKVYSSLLEFAGMIQRELSQMKPKDLIDIQSFIWVIGSDEYR